MDLAGKVALITGCNVGIGKVTALKLAEKGAKVIMACRNMETGEAAREFIVKQSNNSDVVLKQLDLGSFQSVRNFAEDVIKEESKIDILMNNAGLMNVPLGLTVDGYEKHFAVNHLGHFLLTNLLLDLLKKSESARVVVVSSKMAKIASTVFEDMNYERRSYSPYMVYAQSKLANVLFAYQLSRRLEGTNVTAYSLHPGVVKTDIYREMSFVTRILFKPVHLFMKTPEQGAATSLYCALQEGIEEHSGKYFVGSKVDGSAPQKFYDKELSEKVWEMSAKMVGLE